MHIVYCDYTVVYCDYSSTSSSQSSSQPWSRRSADDDDELSV